MQGKRQAGLRGLSGRGRQTGSPTAQCPRAHAPAPCVSSAGPPAHAGLRPHHRGGLRSSPEERKGGDGRAKVIRSRGWGTEAGMDPLLERIPFFPSGSYLDLPEGFQQISMNSEGDLGLLESVALGLGQLPQLRPGSPVPRHVEEQGRSAVGPASHLIPPFASLVGPPLLWLHPGLAQSSPFKHPFLPWGLPANLPPGSFLALLRIQPFTTVMLSM